MQVGCIIVFRKIKRALYFKMAKLYSEIFHDQMKSIEIIQILLYIRRTTIDGCNIRLFIFILALR